MQQTRPSWAEAESTALYIAPVATRFSKSAVSSSPNTVPLAARPCGIDNCGSLPAGYVIHTSALSGMAVRMVSQKRLPVVIANLLSVADKLHLANIAFPSISTGIYGYPVERAAEIALKTIAITFPTLRQHSRCSFCVVQQRRFQSFFPRARSMAATKPECFAWT